jgi:hypothetical protein
MQACCVAGMKRRVRQPTRYLSSYRYALRSALTAASPSTVRYIHTSTTPTMAAPPSIPPMASSDSFNPDFAASTGPNEDAAPVSPIDDTAAPLPSSPELRAPAQDSQTQQRVHDVLHSDIGVTTLLSRLKASIASARVGLPSPRIMPCC